MASTSLMQLNKCVQLFFPSKSAISNVKHLLTRTGVIKTWANLNTAIAELFEIGVHLRRIFNDSYELQFLER